MNSSFNDEIRLTLVERLNAKRARRFVLNEKIDATMLGLRDLELLRNEVMRQEDALWDELERKLK